MDDLKVEDLIYYENKHKGMNRVYVTNDEVSSAVLTRQIKIKDSQTHWNAGWIEPNLEAENPRYQSCFMEDRGGGPK